ncbi:MAG: copper amine oxidase N-terminal domain-containing protein [Candidatus Eremiobacteraeota bacterium]|nr:copper amine oxidase N-terminal domain-containing protein [Candidatus Eremiobacteraeota bacterium]
MNERRRSWLTLAITAVVALAVSLVLAFSNPAEVRVDGQNLISDVPPVTHLDHVYVPLRAVADALGADIGFEKRTGSLEVMRNGQVLKLRVGDPHASLNGMKMTLKHPVFIVRGRVMIGLKAISRAFGVRVSYDKRSARIDVNTPGVIEADTGTSR